MFERCILRQESRCVWCGAILASHEPDMLAVWEKVHPLICADDPQLAFEFLPKKPVARQLPFEASIFNRLYVIDAS